MMAFNAVDILEHVLLNIEMTRSASKPMKKHKETHQPAKSKKSTKTPRKKKDLRKNSSAAPETPTPGKTLRPLELTTNQIFSQSLGYASKSRTPCRLPRPHANLTDNKGMSPSIWGPLVWRILHGLAKIYDYDTLCTACDSPAKCQHAFAAFLLILKTILPCHDCRSSYSQYMARTSQQLVEAFATSEVMLYVFHLHNMVNEKLGKPKFGPFELVQRRSEVWDCEAIESELLGLCFIVTLNYNANQEANKEAQYAALPRVIMDVLRAFKRNSRLLATLDSSFNTWNGHVTQDVLLFHFTAAHNQYYDVTARPSELANRYGLCRT